MTLKVGLGAAQCSRASLSFNECDRFLFGHGLAPVFTMRAGQRGGELESDDFSFHDGCRIHGIKLSEEHGRDKRCIRSLPFSVNIPFFNAVAGNRWA